MYKWGPSTQHHVDVNVRDINLIDLEPSWACAFLASQQKRLGNFLGEKEGEREREAEFEYKQKTAALPF